MLLPPKVPWCPWLLLYYHFLFPLLPKPGLKTLFYSHSLYSFNTGIMFILSLVSQVLSIIHQDLGRSWWSFSICSGIQSRQPASHFGGLGVSWFLGREAFTGNLIAEWQPCFPVACRFKTDPTWCTAMACFMGRGFGTGHPACSWRGIAEEYGFTLVAQPRLHFVGKLKKETKEFRFYYKGWLMDNLTSQRLNSFNSLVKLDKFLWLYKLSIYKTL